jgi:hypothetical protein
MHDYHDFIDTIGLLECLHSMLQYGASVFQRQELLGLFATYATSRSAG